MLPVKLFNLETLCPLDTSLELLVTFLSFVGFFAQIFKFSTSDKCRSIVQLRQAMLFVAKTKKQLPFVTEICSYMGNNDNAKVLCTKIAAVKSARMKMYSTE